MAVTSFLGGYLCLSLEVVGYRVLAPHFGYSVYVFGSLIASVLVFLALGYWLGGECSRRRLPAEVLAAAWLVSATYLTVSLWLAPTVLVAVEPLGSIAGPVVAAAALWAAPLATFAASSPYLVGLAATAGHPGRAAGLLSSIGTLGGLAGTCAASFWLVPQMGARATLASLVATSAGVGVLWGGGTRRIILLASLAVSGAWLAVRQKDSNDSSVIYSAESRYSLLEVIDAGKLLGLRTDRRSGVAYSVATKDGTLPPTLLYQLFAVAPSLLRARSCLILGLGAGTLVQVHESLNAGLRITGVELDPQVVSVGYRYFSLGSRANLDTVVIADARLFLRRLAKSFDIIEVDLYRGTQIPFHTVTEQFFGLVRRRLTENGRLLVNVYDPSKDRAILRAIENTVAAVFPDVSRIPAGGRSFFLSAGMKPLTRSELSLDPTLAGLERYYFANQVTIRFSPDRTKFVDDRAPIETLYDH